MKLAPSRQLALGVMWGVLAVLMGCGEYGKLPRRKGPLPVAQNKVSSKEDAKGRSASEGLAPNEERADQPASSTDSTQSSKFTTTDSTGRKWIGDIPYDVWFDDPLATAGKGAELTGAASTVTDSTISGPVVEQSAAQKKDGSTKPSENQPVAIDWKELVTADVLDGEVKTIRNQLTASLQSIGRYNSKYKEVQTMGSTLAAVAAIAIEHPEPLRWKQQAPSIRDLGNKLEEAAQGTGAKPYEAARATLESLVGLLDGNSAAESQTSANRVSFAECADRGGVMKRIDQSFQWLKKDIATEQALRNSAEKVRHESSLLAALARVIASPEYPSADEPAYVAHAQALVQSAKQMSLGARSGNFAEFSAARDVVQKKCNECHTEYRF